MFNAIGIFCIHPFDIIERFHFSRVLLHYELQVFCQIFVLDELGSQRGYVRVGVRKVGWDTVYICYLNLIILLVFGISYLVFIF